MRYLWRLGGAAQQAQAERWAAGVGRHLRHQPLTLALVWRAGELRRYVALDGCARCEAAGCARLCHRMLFAQLVRAALPGVSLTAVPRIVAGADERERAVVIPAAADAAPLDASFLTQWGAGRLSLTWGRAQGGGLLAGALLAVGAQGPGLRSALLERGWAVEPLATLIWRRRMRSMTAGPAPALRRAGPALAEALHDPLRWAGGALSAGPEEA